MGSLLKFFFLSYAVTWACFITVVRISHGPAPTAPALALVRGFLLLLGPFALSLVALGITASGEGRPGVRALLRRVVQWQVDTRWYLFAIGYLPVIKLSVALAHRVMTGSWPPFGTEPWYIIVVAIAVSTPVQAGEES